MPDPSPAPRGPLAENDRDDLAVVATAPDSSGTTPRERRYARTILTLNAAIAQDRARVDELVRLVADGLDCVADSAAIPAGAPVEGVVAALRALVGDSAKDDERCICPPDGYSWSSVVTCPQHGTVMPAHMQADARDYEPPYRDWWLAEKAAHDTLRRQLAEVTAENERLLADLQDAEGSLRERLAEVTAERDALVEGVEQVLRDVEASIGTKTSRPFFRGKNTAYEACAGRLRALLPRTPEQEDGQ